MNNKTLALAILFLTATFSLSGIIEEIRLKIDNLDCEFCSKTLTNKLLKLPEVKAVTLNKGKALVTIELEKQNNTSPISLKDFIESKTRYTVRDIGVTATGNIINREENLVFDTGEYSCKIYLAEVKKPTQTEQPQKKVSKTKTNKRGQAFVAAGSKVWNKTTSFVKGFLPSSDKFEAQIKQYSNYKTPIRLTGSINQNQKGQLWLSSKYYAYLKEANNEGIKLGFASKK